LSVPGSAEHAEELKKRFSAAHAWLTKNTQLALVVPHGVARDLFPSGYGQKEWDSVIAHFIPGESVESVEISGNQVFVLLKRA